MNPIKELEINKIYEASTSLVWNAWTDPEQLRQWWGPDNVDIAECEVDLRVGGRFYIVMVAGEAMGPYKGVRWPMDARYTIVEENLKLSYDAKAWTEGQEKTTQIDQTTHIELFDEGNKTRILLKATINNTGPNAKMAVEGMEMGFNQQLKKLEKFLE